MYRAAVIGDKDSVYGFRALGLDVTVAQPDEDLSALFRKISEQNYAVIYITEALASKLEHEIERLSCQQTPAVILIPGVTGNTGEGLSAVKRSVEKAVGSDIVFNS